MEGHPRLQGAITQGFPKSVTGVLGHSLSNKIRPPKCTESHQGWVEIWQDFGVPCLAEFYHSGVSTVISPLVPHMHQSVHLSLIHTIDLNTTMTKWIRENWEVGKDSHAFPTW